MKQIYKQQIALGYDSSGRRVRKWAYGNSLPELNRNIRKLQDEFDAIRNPSNDTFRIYSEKWLETYKAHKSINTYTMYNFAISKCSALDPYKMQNITHTQLQAVINANIDHLRLCQQIAMTLRQIFKAALKDGIIASNPADGLDVPKYKAKEKRSLTEKERKIIRTVKLPDRERVYLDLLYYCGLRRGEALTLTRADFDFKALLLTVNKSIAFDKNTPVVKDTKTHAARYVPIPEQIAKRLKKYIKGSGFQLFTNADGSMITRSGFRQMWKTIADTVNTTSGGTDKLKVFRITPHMLRHDYATRLYYVPGISTKQKAEILGHQEDLFIKLYSHIDQNKEDFDTFRKLMNF